MAAPGDQQLQQVASFLGLPLRQGHGYPVAQDPEATQRLDLDRVAASPRDGGQQSRGTEGARADPQPLQPALGRFGRGASAMARPETCKRELRGCLAKRVAELSPDPGRLNKAVPLSGRV